MRVEVEEYMGVPLYLVQPYADTLDQMSRAVQQRVATTDPFVRYILERAMLVLQGRLEGVALAWCSWCKDPEQDDTLRIAAISYAARTG